jgi:hypothetical protein
MRSYKILFVISILMILTSACSQSAPPLGSEDMKATVNAAVQKTQTAVASSFTPTPVPPKPAPTSIFEATPVPDSASPTEEKSDTATVNVPEGWNLYQDTEGDFSVAVPSNWMHLDLRQGSVEKILQAGIASNPAFKRAYTAEDLSNMMSSGVKLIAMEILDATATDTVITNMNVIEQDLDPSIAAMDMQDLAPVMEKQIQQAFNKEFDVASRVIEINGRDALEVRYSTNMNDSQGNSETLAFTQYITLGSTKQYIITFTALAAREDVYFPTFLKIIKTFQIGE